VLAGKLGSLKCGGCGVFIASTTKVAVGEGCCRRAHRTVWCASHVTQPLGFDHWSSDMWGHRTVRWCTRQSLFTVRCAFCACSDSACAVCALFTHCSLLQTTVGAISCCSAWHTEQSGATSDSPVNYSGVAPQIPKASELELIHPGAPDTIRWCIVHCPVVHRTLFGGTPDSPVCQTRVAFGWFCSFLFEPFLGLFIGLC
jgi:hypothetical protein